MFRNLTFYRTFHFYFIFFCFSVIPKFLLANSLEDFNKVPQVNLKPVIVKTTRSNRELQDIPASLHHVGSSEIQIGLLSEKINILTEHFKKNKSDKHSGQGLLKAVNRRKRLLSYLKRKSRESYAKILTKLNLRK